eukprot:2610992-Alexandrium_andersonii.AAC.1
MCEHGLLETSGRWAVRKPTRLLASHEAFQLFLERRCSGEHEHFQLHGSRETRAAAGCTAKFARRVRLALAAADPAPSAPVASVCAASE